VRGLNISILKEAKAEVSESYPLDQ